MQKLQIKNYKFRNYFLITAVFLVYILLTPQAAFAHHFADNNAPDNILEGFFSGIFHPILGIDHLAFMLAAALIIAISKASRVATPFFLILGLLTGVFLHIAKTPIPYLEYLIVSSILILGLALTFKINLKPYQFVPILTFASVFHGYALAESVIGVYDTQIATFYSYLIGMGFIQYLLCVTFSFLLSRNVRNIELTQKVPQYIGICVSITGITFATMLG